MKKMISIVFMLSCICIFSACGNVSRNTSLSENNLNFAFSDYIGMRKNEALSAMGLTDDDFTPSALQGKYDLTETAVFHDISFTTYLLFGNWEDTDDCLYGGGYEYISESGEEQLLTVLREIAALMTTRYGEPSTYPTMAYRFEYLNELSDLSPGAYFMETWNASEQPAPEGEVSADAREVTVRIENLDGRIRIAVQYQIMNPLLQQNPG